MKYPWFKFFSGDYLGDSGVRSVSLAARGLWADMLCLMHQSAHPGHLAQSSGQAFSDAQLARIVGGAAAEVAKLLRELEDSSVFSRTPEGVIFCRRMVRDTDKRDKCAEAGRRGGGNPNLHPNEAAPINGTFKGEGKGPDKDQRKGDAIGESKGSTIGEVKGNFAPNSIKLEARSQKLETRETEISKADAFSPPPQARGGPSFPPAVIDEIYRAYPRKKQPEAARRAIVKALGLIAKREGIPDAATWLTGRVQAYAVSRANEDPQFTPYPATWFRAGSYDEDFTEPAGPSTGTNGHHQPHAKAQATATTKYDF